MSGYVLSNLFFADPSLSLKPSSWMEALLPPNTHAMVSIAPQQSLPAAEEQIIRLFEQSTPSVVYINTYVNRIDAFSMNILEVPAGTGSGFVWDRQGHIVTNYHVIRNSETATVTATSEDGKTTRTFKAQVTGVDPDKDVAILSASSEDPLDKNPWQWKPVSVGSSKSLRVGQMVLAIGNPFGLDHTLTTGIVSGLGREVRSPNNKPIQNVIQTDAAINPGNSGGPLLDSSGRLIGMNTAIYTLSGSSAGIGFAIPVDTLTYEVDTLLRDGKVVRPALGVTYLERIDEVEIVSEADLFKALDGHRVGDTVRIRLLRAVDASATPSTSLSPDSLPTGPTISVKREELRNMY
eukprot:gene27096-35811_t